MTEKTVFLNEESYAGPLVVARNPKIRRLRLRIDRKKRLPVLVLNNRILEKTGLEFAKKNAGWIGAQMSRLPEKKRFENAAILPLFGQNVVIHHAPDAKRGVWLENGVLWVSGHEEHLPRRVADFIKDEMKKKAKARLAFYGGVLGARIGKLTIRDTKSRWGSCNVNGDVSLSWRLAFAPENVMDYVIVHELCHTFEMNHSDRFWKRVAAAFPDFETAEKWLKKNAAFLYGFSLD